MSSATKLSWLPGAATALSLFACYGTLAGLAVLGMLGATIALNEAVWAGAIVAFAGVAVVGLAIGFSRHRVIWPLVIGGLGAAVIGYAMFVDYARLTELAGFALLCAGVIWDWRVAAEARSTVA